MEIEVGEFVRTKDKILKIDSFEKDMRNIDCVCFTTVEIYTKELLNEIITNHSKNIIDLIEVGDYVNRERVLDITGDYIRTSEFIHNKYWLLNNIKTILTYEQYEKNCYRLEE